MLATFKCCVKTEQLFCRADPVWWEVRSYSFNQSITCWWQLSECCHETSDTALTLLAVIEHYTWSFAVQLRSRKRFAGECREKLPVYHCCCCRWQIPILYRVTLRWQAHLQHQLFHLLAPQAWLRRRCQVLVLRYPVTASWTCVTTRQVPHCQIVASRLMRPAAAVVHGEQQLRRLLWTIVPWQMCYHPRQVLQICCLYYFLHVFCNVCVLRAVICLIVIIFVVISMCLICRQWFDGVSWALPVQQSSEVLLESFDEPLASQEPEWWSWYS